jgi:hypothetical protein
MPVVTYLLLTGPETRLLAHLKIDDAEELSPTKTISRLPIRVLFFSHGLLKLRH